MDLKISYLELWQPSCSVERNHLCNLVEGIMGNIHVKLFFKFGPMVQEMSFKDISYLELWQPLCSVEWNHLFNFGSRLHEEQFL